MTLRTPPPNVLGAAAALLQPYFPDASPSAIVAALQGRGQPTPVGQRRMLTPAEAGAALGCCAMTIKRQIHAGTLPGVRVGNCWRVPVSAIDALAAGAAPVEG